MEQMNLFDMAEAEMTFDTRKKLQVVHAEFIDTESMTWQTLFDGYDEMHVITFSSGIHFMNQVLERFGYVEIIFGCEGVLDESIATIMAVEAKLIEELAHNREAIKICDKMQKDELRLYVSRNVKSHEKIFCLKARDGRTRVITGSANMSASAFCGIQRESITYYDDIKAYEWYMNRFMDFREECSDNVNENVLLRTINDRTFLKENPEEIPIVKTIEKKKMLIIESDATDGNEAEIIADVKGLEAELKPMLPKVKKAEGKLLVTAEAMKKICSNIRENVALKKEKQKKLPKLHVDYDTQKLTFNGQECNLNPDKKDVEGDIRSLLNYLSSLNAFYGDVAQAQKEYFAFMNWYFASLFMPYLRYIASKNGYEVMPFPVVGIIYGESNGGKSTFLKMLTKLMCNTKIPLNVSSDFTSTNIEDLKRGCEGIPLNIDDLDKTQFQNHAGKIIKDDEWGIREGFINYPAIAITTNKLPSLEAPISKRAIGCRINVKIEKEAGAKNAKRINESMRSITNCLYCEYVRRMLPKVADMVEHMKAGDEEYFPDIFKISSEVLVEIIHEYIAEDIPDYFVVLSYSDYFGEKVVGRNAIAKIKNAWENEPKQFSIDKKKNRLVYTYPDSANVYELRYICDELPPKLNAKVASKCLSMDLKQACEFFGVRFRKSFF